MPEPKADRRKAPLIQTRGEVIDGYLNLLCLWHFSIKEKKKKKKDRNVEKKKKSNGNNLQQFQPEAFYHLWPFAAYFVSLWLQFISVF